MNDSQKHDGNSVNISVIQMPEPQPDEEQQYENTVYYPLLHAQVSVTLKRLLLKPRKEILYIAWDPIRLLPQLCDCIPLHREKTVSKSAIIPFDSDQQSPHSSILAYAQNFVSHKYPLIFKPIYHLDPLITLYKPYVQYPKNQDNTLWILEDPVSGQTTEFCP